MIIQCCEFCKKDFKVYPYRLKKVVKFCSSKCYGLSNIGKKSWNYGLTKETCPKLSNSGVKIGNKPWNKNKKTGLVPRNAFKRGHTPWGKGKKFLQTTGENNVNWKGENVGYFALHSWVKRHKGSPVECEKCKKNDKQSVYDWANIDHKYRRNLDDYIRLCRSCHRKHDYHLIT